MKTIIYFFMAFTMIALIGSCKSKSEKVAVAKDLSLDTNLLVLNDTLSTEKDSIINGRVAFFFWFSPSQLERRISTMGLLEPKSDSFVHSFVNGKEYTEISHNNKMNCLDSRLVFIGDSSTKITTSKESINNILLERMKP